MISRAAIMIVLGLMACDGAEVVPSATAATIPEQNLSTAPEVLELTTLLTELVSAAGHTGVLPIELGIAQTRYGSSGASLEPVRISDQEIIKHIFGSNPNAPVSWQIHATWENNGTRAWVLSSEQSAGGGAYHVRMVTLRNGQYTRWSVGSEGHINCGDSHTFTGTVSESGVLTSVLTSWTEQCGDGNGSSDNVVQRVDYGLDGSMTLHP